MKILDILFSIPALTILVPIFLLYHYRPGNEMTPAETMETVKGIIPESKLFNFVLKISCWGLVYLIFS